MEEKVYPMTLEGKAKLEAELEDLKVNKRKEIIERIKIARSYGDLSENSEYDAAKDEQAFVEGRISVIEKMIRFASLSYPAAGPRLRPGRSKPRSTASGSKAGGPPPGAATSAIEDRKSVV